MQMNEMFQEQSWLGMDIVSGIFSMIDLLTKHEKLIALNASIKAARAEGAI